MKALFAVPSAKVGCNMIDDQKWNYSKMILFLNLNYKEKLLVKLSFGKSNLSPLRYLCNKAMMARSHYLNQCCLPTIHPSITILDEVINKILRNTSHYIFSDRISRLTLDFRESPWGCLQRQWSCGRTPGLHGLHGLSYDPPPLSHGTRRPVVNNAGSEARSHLWWGNIEEN